MDTNAQNTQLNYTIAPWKDNKKAAVSLTLDDAILGQFTIAVPLLNKYGLKATFFITPRIMVQQGITWKMVNDAAASSHEIANHTLDHPWLRRQTIDSIIYQVDGCNKLIDKNITTQKCVTMAYPFGDGGNATDSERLVLKTIMPYCIGSRATRNNSLSYNTYNFAKGDNEAYYKVNSDMIADSATMAGFAAQVDATIAAGGWYVPTYHGIETGWIITPAAVFEKHLQALVVRQNDVWVTPFANALKYHKERNCATLKIIRQDEHTLRLLLTDTLQNSAVWNEPLTINLTVSYKVASIMRGGKRVPFTMNGAKVVFNVVPGKEEIVVEG